MQVKSPPKLVQPVPMTNERISDSLLEVADLLEAQAANPYRIAAYRTAAETIRQLDVSASEILSSKGLAGLMEQKGIGRSLANHIAQLVETGRLLLLDRLRGDYRVERMFATVPDIGPRLAQRIHEHLHIENLLELYAVAVDGRLAGVPGMGPKRIRAVRESLAGRLRGSEPSHELSSRAHLNTVPVGELLDVDHEYRRLAQQNKLPRVAPRRFNPTAAAWLPILHTHRDDRHYTAMYSNTAHAHDMGTTHDWVVIYRDDEFDDGRWTAITAQFGHLRGRRIIRGREAECATHYAHSARIDGAASLSSSTKS